MSENSFKSLTVLVTGGDKGLGYETARRFVAGGATVYLHARDLATGEEALTRLIDDGADPLRLQLVVADFTRLAEVRSLGERLAGSMPGLDVLVNNAAIAAPQGRTFTENGIEATFQVNYLAPYVLTTALAGRIESRRGRVVNVSSNLHRGGSVDFADLSRLRRGYSPLAVYAQSKLALTMFTRSLADSHPAALTAVSVYPGFLDTERPTHGPANTSVTEAARLLTMLSAPSTTVVSGQHYEMLEQMGGAALVEKPRARERLARLSAELAKAA
ncbi:SDR family NAD(P)-dependent oxidoreductase [Rhodococcus daqingensis]|uniref:SDR family NAD(P)-dependent oxidoreductase n=1 Tax=Rhodococcus daqingensis TaxID=2479363 RepID=A0ABW2S3Q6_9NOCA